MNQSLALTAEEWFAQFQKNNGRAATPAEYQQALDSGMIKTVDNIADSANTAANPITNAGMPSTSTAMPTNTSIEATFNKITTNTCIFARELVNDGKNFKALSNLTRQIFLSKVSGLATVLLMIGTFLPFISMKLYFSKTMNLYQFYKVTSSLSGNSSVSMDGMFIIGLALIIVAFSWMVYKNPQKKGFRLTLAIVAIIEGLFSSSAPNSYMSQLNGSSSTDIASRGFGFYVMVLMALILLATGIAIIVFYVLERKESLVVATPATTGSMPPQTPSVPMNPMPSTSSETGVCPPVSLPEQPHTPQSNQ